MEYQVQVDSGGSAAGGCFVSIVYLAILALIVIGLWKVYVKAGKPGWAAIVPIYNIIVLLEIVGKPLWWVVLFFIPVVNLIASIIVYIELARLFGKGTGFGLGLVFLSPIFFPILGFGSAKYIGAPAAAGAPPAPPAPPVQ